MQSITGKLSRDFKRFMTGLTPAEEDARRQQQNRFLKDFKLRATQFKKVAQDALAAEQRVVTVARSSIASGGEMGGGARDSDEERDLLE